jgi:Flp pilus assembly protein TadB
VREHGERPAERLHVRHQVRPDQHGFAGALAGNEPDMIGVGIALIVVGIIFLFIIPWVGIPVGIVGLILAILYFAGFGRRAARAEQPQQPR